MDNIKNELTLANSNYIINKPKKISRTFNRLGGWEDRFWVRIVHEHRVSIDFAITFYYNDSGILYNALCEGGDINVIDGSSREALLHTTFPFELVPQGANCAMFSYIIDYSVIKIRAGCEGGGPECWEEQKFYSFFWDETYCR